MKSIRKFRRSFIRQITDFDCGRACLMMIFRYAGKEIAVNSLKNIFVDDSGLSLLSLKRISTELGLPSRCVTMEIAHLRELSAPCIIHARTVEGRDHFLVCYGLLRENQQTFYIIGDPSEDLITMEENEIEKLWVSKGALIFPDLNYGIGTSFYKFGIFAYLRQFKNSRALLIIFPILSLGTIALGIGFAWLLQETARSPAPENSIVVACWVLLLILLTMSRSILSFIRQQLLVYLTSISSDLFNEKIIDHVFFDRQANNGLSDNGLKAILADIQKINQANLALTSILLPDLFLGLAFTITTGYLIPESMILTAIYIGFQSWMIDHHLSNRQPRLNGLVKDVKNFEISFALSIDAIDRGPDQELIGKLNQSQHERYQKLALRVKNFGKNSNRHTLAMEIGNSVYLTALFLISIFLLHKGAITPGQMILLVAGGFYISTIPIRMFSSLPQVESGIEASRRLAEICD